MELNFIQQLSFMCGGRRPKAFGNIMGPFSILLRWISAWTRFKTCFMSTTCITLVKPNTVYVVEDWGCLPGVESGPVLPLKLQEEELFERFGGGWRRTERAPSLPDSLQDTASALQDTDLQLLLVRLKGLKQMRHKPAEKGMKASRLRNFPSLLRKWAG